MADVHKLGTSKIFRISETSSVTAYMHASDGCGKRFWLEGDTEPEFCPACGQELTSIIEELAAAPSEKEAKP
jgi:rRNA maturation endonuclease Nob1